MVCVYVRVAPGHDRTEHTRCVLYFRETFSLHLYYFFLDEVFEIFRLFNLSKFCTVSDDVFPVFIRLLIVNGQCRTDSRRPFY